jgi:hypothetical protein
MSTAKAPRRFPARACTPSSGRRRERTQGWVTAVPGVSRSAGRLLPTRSDPAGHSRRNAVGRVGVKLVAAPDAPHWGEVLVRSPSDRFFGARRGATSKFTCQSRDSQVCPSLDRDPGGARPRPRWPASSGGGRRRGQTNSRPEVGLRIAQNAAWTLSQADMAVIAARKTRPRVSAVRTGDGDPHPGRTPCERNHGPVLRRPA